MMKNFKINVRQEGEWFLASVLDENGEIFKDEPYYSQGHSYEEALSNLFSVIQNIREINRKEEKQEYLKEGITFSIPCFA